MLFWGALNLTVRLLSFLLVEVAAPAAAAECTCPSSTITWFSTY